MTTHYSEKYLVKTYTALLSYTSKKDGKQQVIIRVRIIPRDNKSKDKRIDFSVYDNLDQPIRLTASEFKSNRYSNAIKGRIAEIDERIIFSIHHFLSHDLKLNKKRLYEFIYTNLNQVDNIISMEYETNPEILRQLGVDDPIPKDVVNEFYALPAESFEDAETGEQIDTDIILNSLEVKYNKKKEEDSLKDMDYLERYEKGLFDKDNIFDVFGYCWTTNKLTGKPYVKGAYRGLILKLADYRYNKNPEEHIRNFNLEWVEDFIIYLKIEGYPVDFHPKKYHPFNLHKYASDLISKDRKVYSYSTFDKWIKHLIYCIEILQELRLIPRVNVDTRDIYTSKYLSNKITPYTRSSHALLKSELDLLFISQLKDEKLELARIMFLIQTFAGGLRNDEFFNRYFKLKQSGDDYYFSFYANKTHTFEENPTIEGYSDVLLEHLDFELPKFLTLDEYRIELRKLAKELKLDREIRIQTMKANDEIIVDDVPIYDLINPYWCRKTFVKFARTKGWTNEKICDFTGHKDPKTINYYFDKLSHQEKKELTKK